MTYRAIALGSIIVWDSKVLITIFVINLTQQLLVPSLSDNCNLYNTPSCHTTQYPCVVVVEIANA